MGVRSAAPSCCGTSLGAVHVYYENVNPCGDYWAGDKGAPAFVNQAYYINYDGLGSVVVGCNNGSHRNGYSFLYRKGTFGSAPFFTGYMSGPDNYASAMTETVNNPTINTDYVGCQGPGACSISGFGIHVLTAPSTWNSWTGPATAIHDNPPWLHTYNNYWSFKTCPSAC